MLPKTSLKSTKVVPQFKEATAQRPKDGDLWELLGDLLSALEPAGAKDRHDGRPGRLADQRQPYQCPLLGVVEALALHGLVLLEVLGAHAADCLPAARSAWNAFTAAASLPPEHAKMHKGSRC